MPRRDRLVDSYLEGLPMAQAAQTQGRDREHRCRSDHAPHGELLTLSGRVDGMGHAELDALSRAGEARCARHASQAELIAIHVFKLMDHCPSDVDAGQSENPASNGCLKQ